MRDRAISILVSRGWTWEEADLDVCFLSVLGVFYIPGIAIAVLAHI